jgi:hypothetical protein
MNVQVLVVLLGAIAAALVFLLARRGLGPGRAFLMSLAVLVAVEMALLFLH